MAGLELVRRGMGPALMATVVRMPAALAGVTEGAIQTWIAAAGQTIAAGDPLAEIETEKAVVEYAAEVGGTVARLLAEPGENVAVGAPIAVILAAGESDDAVDAALAEAGVVGATAGNHRRGSGRTTGRGSETSPTAAQVVEPPSGDRVFASPIVRRLAKERGVDLDSLTGTGPDGRIVRRDLDRAASAAPGRESGAASAPASRAVAAAAGSIVVPLTGMRRAIARRLTESKTTVPHFYVTAHCHVDALLALRSEVNAVVQRKVSLNDFVLKAVAGCPDEGAGGECDLER